MLRQEMAIEKDFALAHDGFKMQIKFLAFETGLGTKVFAIPHNALIIDTAAGFRWEIVDTVGQRNDIPSCIIEITRLGTALRTFAKTPGGIHGEDFAPGIWQLKETSRGKFGLALCS